MGHEVVETGSGLEALTELLGSDPPLIAILDWMMDDIEGIQVCKEVRRKLEKENDRIQPYLIIMTAKSGVDEITAGLDAGADDYLTKPWNDKVLIARLRVAERTIALQAELRQQIAEMKRVLRRYNLLQNVMSRHVRASQVPPPPVECQEEGFSFSHKYQESKTLVSISETLSNAFGKLGCGPVDVRRVNGSKTRDDLNKVLWSGMYDVDKESWLDFLFEVDGRSGHLLHEGVMGERARNEEELNDALSEIVFIVVDSFRASFQNEGAQFVVASHPKAFSKSGLRIPSLKSGHFCKLLVRIGHEIQVQVTVSEHESEVSIKPIKSAKEFDILVDHLKSPWDGNVTMLKKGAALSSVYLQKLRLFQTQKTEIQVRVHVIEPSPFARLAFGINS